MNHGLKHEIDAGLAGELQCLSNVYRGRHATRNIRHGDNWTYAKGLIYVWWEELLSQIIGKKDFVRYRCW